MVREFLQQQFGLQATMGQIAWTLVIALFTRLWFKFAGLTLSKKKEIGFWILAPLSVFTLIAIVEMVAIQTPRLKGNIDFVAVGDRKDGNILVVFFATIVNSGSPSIISHWEARIEVPGQKPIEIEAPTKIPGPMLIPHTNDSTASLAIYPNEALDERTVTTPIAQGAAVRGVLLFSTHAGSIYQVISSPTTLVLIFHDVNGRTYELTENLANINKTNYGFPGLRSGNVINPPKQDVEGKAK